MLRIKFKLGRLVKFDLFFQRSEERKPEKPALPCDHKPIDQTAQVQPMKQEVAVNRNRFLQPTHITMLMILLKLIEWFIKK